MAYNEVDVARYVRWYSRRGNNQVGEEKIESIDMNLLSNILNPPQSDKRMYGCYKVNKENVDRIQSLVKGKMDIEEYDYFVECDSKD